MTVFFLHLLYAVVLKCESEVDKHIFRLYKLVLGNVPPCLINSSIKFQNLSFAVLQLLNSSRLILTQTGTAIAVGALSV